MIQEKILAWYKQKGRDLPWRKTRDPYKILVSEVMLQQTQVPRVLQKYPVFLTKYPTFSALADASNEDLLRAWEGMGYNNRILRLKRLATVVRDAPLPREPQKLMEFDGIGPYTAHAIACFAYNQDVPLVDVNIRRIFSRVFHKQRFFEEMRPEKEMWQLASKLVPKSQGYDWNQALMDFGSLICTARDPHCTTCPLQEMCKSAGSMKQQIKKKMQKKGTPDRIYRGKVIQFLRKNDNWVDKERIILEVRADGTAKWWETIFNKLAKEGLLQTEGKKVRL